ncbi:MAG: hypothetical protein HYX93_07090 [Chloroflexi bacterium]|nr:hypothetical protein [Chloroflexota bacterium]
MRKLLVATVLALLLSLANMAASVVAGPGPVSPSVINQRDCPHRDGEPTYLYVADGGQVVRCLAD